MYSEQMMREQGFDDAPNFRLDDVHRRDLAGLPDHPRRPDAPRRAERRGGHGVPDRRRRASRARTPGPRSTATRTRRPTSCRTCSARSSCSSSGPTSSDASAPRFDLRRLPRHAAAQRVAADQLPPPAAARDARLGRELRRLGVAGRARRLNARCVQVIPSIDLAGGRSRVVFWPGVAAGIGAPTDRPDRIAERFVELGARLIHLVDFDGAQTRQPGEPRRGRRDRVARRGPDPARRRPRGPRPDPARVRGRGDARRPGDGVVDDPPLLADCLAVAGDWLAVGLDPRPERLAAFPWRRPSPPASFEALVDELVARGVPRFVLSHGGAEPDARAPGPPRPLDRRRHPRRRRRVRPRRDPPAARSRRGGHHSRRGAPVRGHRLPAALEAAA